MTLQVPFGALRECLETAGCLSIQVSSHKPLWGLQRLSWNVCLPISLPPPLSACFHSPPGTGTPDLRLSLCVSVCPSAPIHSPPELAFGPYTNPLWASDMGFTFARSQLPQWVMAVLYSHPGDVSPVSCEVCMGAGVSAKRSKRGH